MRIRPEEQGLRAALFDLEADIMEVVWAKGLGPFAVLDVLRELERNRDIAYTTVMTTVCRLHNKGLLSRVRDRRRYMYQPLMSRDEFSALMAREVLSSLTGLGHNQAMALLVDQVAAADADELRRLERMIRQRRKDLAK